MLLGPDWVRRGTTLKLHVKAGKESQWYKRSRKVLSKISFRITVIVAVAFSLLALTLKDILVHLKMAHRLKDVVNIRLLFVLTNVHHPESPLAVKVSNCLTSIMEHRSETQDALINIHLVVDGKSEKIARDHIVPPMLTRFPQHTHAIQVAYSPASPLAGAVQSKLSADALRHFRHSAQSYYGDYLFFLSLAAAEIFTSWDKVIMLDADLLFQDDVLNLWRLFDDFAQEQLVGIAYEQQPVYRNVFSSHRRANPRTVMGDPPPAGKPGFNSGVLLLHLDKMRQPDSRWQHVISAEHLAVMAEKYAFQGHLGDQDVYTLLSSEHMDIFYVLPCTWNRQLCTWWKTNGGFTADLFDMYHRCNGPVKIYHGNCNTPFPIDS